ncbi:hypothetical protein [Variovorax sp.]|uniref:hypothetical protein n=1 Tax=Variovorax sp. TaxID=1871043 RepID=UPI0037DA3870
MSVPDASGGAGAAVVTSQIINAKWQNALQWFNRAFEFGDDVMAAIGVAPQLTPPTLDKTYLPPDAPQISFDDPNAAMAYFDSKNAELSALIDSTFQRMLGETFPDMGYISAALAWCNRAVTQGGTGINPAVEAALWERARARVAQEADRAVADIENRYARAGWPLPPGAMLHQTGLVRQDSRNKLAEQSRDIAVKSFDAELENVRFAVKSVMDQYIQAIAAVGDYVKTVMLGPQISMQLATSTAGLKNEAARTLTALYSAQTAALEPRVRLAIADADIQQQAATVNLRARTETAQMRAQGMLANLKMLGDSAAASFNGIGAGASISGGDSSQV